ncbi:dsDNA nuclease domain-containing protein [Leptospira stimsonii]|uniref:CD-NTase associated protein 4-like DNA endonuclease domain-containing protein n=1 Tax=Leptospira stimsonii TaxID=2202203 RepID=A0A396YPD4_9LEPT|nr:dsDNA nuclease domain-containing protein [Leptospira stimsonii]RHX83923.1 hypothetical protein DLM75_23560 [Leptospira stimsonii]
MEELKVKRVYLMAKTGGSAAKLGNQFEDLWSWREILRLLENEILSITFEPEDDPVGIEYAVTCLDGTREYHSVKNRSEASWTVTQIAKPDNDSGRSILKDLVRRLELDQTAKAYFKSSAKNIALSNLPPLFRKLTSFQELNFELSAKESEEVSGEYCHCTNLETKPNRSKR